MFRDLLIVTGILLVLVATGCGKPVQHPSIESRPWPVSTCPEGYEQVYGTFGTDCKCVSATETIECTKP
jgi:hypothetical protein